MKHHVLNTLMQSSTQTDWRETRHRKPANGPDYSLSRVFYRIVDTIEGMTVRRAG